MARNKHPNKEIEEAIKYAESKGWRYIESGKSAHAWGRLYCSYQSREGCMISIWSTPRDCYKHARQIKRSIDSCPHDMEDV